MDATYKNTICKNEDKSRNRRLKSGLVNMMKMLILAEYLNVCFSELTSIP